MVKLKTSVRGSIKKPVFFIPPLSILLVWALLYLPHLRHSPSWYGDETGALILARNLVEGSLSIGALQMTYLHTYFPLQPGFLFVAGLFANAANGDILGARFLNALLALAIAFLIYFKARFKVGFMPAWFGAGVFLTFAQSVIHFRWIYPHDAVALGFTVALLYLMRAARRRNDWIAGSGLAIAAISHPLFIHGAIASILCRLKKPSSWIRIAIPPSLVLASTVLLITWYYWPEDWLLSDFKNLLSFYRGSSEATVGQSGILANLYRFYTQDLFHLASLICLLVCIRKKTYQIAVFGICISVLLLQNRQNLPVFYYQAIVLSPIFGLAWAAALSRLGKLVRRRLNGLRLERGIYAAAFVAPIMSAAVQLPDVFGGTLTSRNHFWVTQNSREVEQCADWVNGNSDGAGVVVASSNIGWLLKPPSVDLLQVVVWSGRPTEYFRSGMDRRRFLFPLDIDRVQFVVIGDIDQRWTLHQPNVGQIVQRFIDERWPIVWQSENYVVLKNPNYRVKANP